MTFNALKAATIRRCVLDLLAAEKPRVPLNDGVLAKSVTAMGYGCSREQMRGHIAWLADQGLVSVEALSETLHAATLTQRGADVAAGVEVVPGVDHLSPSD